MGFFAYECIVETSKLCFLSSQVSNDARYLVASTWDGVVSIFTPFANSSCVHSMRPHENEDEEEGADKKRMSAAATLSMMDPNMSASL